MSRVLTRCLVSAMVYLSSLVETGAVDDDDLVVAVSTEALEWALDVESLFGGDAVDEDGAGPPRKCRQ